MTAALPRPHRFPTFANGDAAARGANGPGRPRQQAVARAV